MDKASEEKGAAKDLIEGSWLVMSGENSNKQKDSFESDQDDRVPTLKLVRPPITTSANNNTETTKLQDCKQKLDKAINSYTMTKKDNVGKHRLPLAPPPERKKYTHRLTDDKQNKVPPLKVSLKPDMKLLASLRSRSVGTNTVMMITEEEEQILDLVKSAGLTLEGVRKITGEIKNDNNHKNVTKNSKQYKKVYSDMEREFFAKIREALLQSEDANKKQLFPFLYYFSLDNHDCTKSQLCLSEMNEDVTQSPVGSRGCIFKALKDTMVPDNLQKVRKLVRDHILDMAEVYNGKTVEQRKSKAMPTQTEAHLEGCSPAKKVKYTQPSEIPTRITVKKEVYLEDVQLNMAPVTITRSAQPNSVTSSMNGPNNNVNKTLEQSMAVNHAGTATASITQSAQPDLSMTNPMFRPANNVDKKLEQSITVNQINTAAALITQSAQPNLPMTNRMFRPTNNVGKRLDHSMAVNGLNTATAPVSRYTQPNFTMTKPMNGPNNNAGKRLGPSVSRHQMNRQKVLPPLAYIQHNEALPQYWGQPPAMYPAQHTGMLHPVDCRWDSNTQRNISFPNSQWHNSQY